MNYSELLLKSISNTGYSQQQISNIAKNKYNVDIAPSYISKLQSGKKIAGEKINTALAKVCNISPEDLQFEADFEKTPKIVQQTINEIIESLKQLFLNSSEINSYWGKLVIDTMDTLSTRQLLELLSSTNWANSNSNNPFIKDLTNEEALKESDIFSNTSMQMSLNYKMNDGSMSPLIQQGTELLLDECTEIKNGDIVLVQDTKENLFVRFYNKIDNTISLLPMNNSFETIQFKENEIIVCARVIGYIVKF